MAPTVLVVGASRGIGLELVRQYAADGWAVHATTRTPQSPGALGTIAGDVTLHPLDVRSRPQVDELVAALDGVALDVLIHNAGVMRASREEIMAVNAVAPIAVAEALLGNVAAVPGKIALMTSQLGARRGRRGGLGDYGDSKAALNDAFRLRAGAWARGGVIAVVIHPGWVRTDMGGSSAPVAVEDSARGIKGLIDGLTPAMHGRFWTWEGREHDW